MLFVADDDVDDDDFEDDFHSLMMMLMLVMFGLMLFRCFAVRVISSYIRFWFQFGAWLNRYIVLVLCEW